MQKTCIDSRKYFIVVSGFGWSGSGALVDCFLDNSAMSCSGDDELIFIWAYYRIINKLKKKKQINIFHGENENLFCAVVPRGFSQKKKKQYTETFDSYFKKSHIGKEEYTVFCRSLLQNLQKGIITINDATRTYFDFLYDMFNLSDSLIFFDNLFHPHQLDLLLGLDLTGYKQVIVYCVDRDPRDQFYEHYYRYLEGLGLWHTMNMRQKTLTTLARYSSSRKLLNTYMIKQLAAVLFVHMHKKKREKFQKVKGIIDKKHSNIDIKMVSFEQFIYNKDLLRDRIKQEIDAMVIEKCRESKWEEGKHFHPLKSKENIGKYKRDKNQKVFRYLERTLKTYTYQG